MRSKRQKLSCVGNSLRQTSSEKLYGNSLDQRLISSESALLAKCLCTFKEFDSGFKLLSLYLHTFPRTTEKNKETDKSKDNKHLSNFSSIFQLIKCENLLLSFVLHPVILMFIGFDLSVRQNKPLDEVIFRL